VPASPVGTYPIVPTLSDPTGKLSNYAVINKNGVLTVVAAPLTFIAPTAARFYGNANPAPIVLGIKNGDNITADYGPTGPTATTPVGVYTLVPSPIDPTLKLSNYAVTIKNGLLTVSRAPLTVTAGSARRIYGDANPVFTGSIVGLKNADNITATYSTAATTASSVGTYAIVPALLDPDAKLGNYTVTNKNALLTVVAAPLAVSAPTGARFYGDPNPLPTLTGIKNGDNITVGYDVTAPTPASSIGVYALVPALSDPTGKLGNYAVTVKNGLLTVSRTPLSITAASVSRLFGTPNPLLTGSISGVKNGDNITGTYSTTATISSAVGTYFIVPALADPDSRLGNYTVTTTRGVLTITK
jgi:hypothetical protein